MREEKIGFENIIYVLCKRWKFVASVTITITLIVALVSFFLIKPQYEVQAKVFIGKEENKKIEYNSMDVIMYQKLMKTYAEIIQTKNLVNNAIVAEGLDINAKNIQSNLKVVPSADTQILAIKFRHQNPDKALKVINALIEQFILKSKMLIPNGNVQVIEEAEMPNKPITPNNTVNVGIAFVLGLMVSCGLVIILEYFDNTFKTADDFERNLDIPIIGIIPTEYKEK